MEPDDLATLFMQTKFADGELGNFICLPEEILVVILGYITSVRDVLRLRRVCKTFQRLLAYAVTTITSSTKHVPTEHILVILPNLSRCSRPIFLRNNLNLHRLCKITKSIIAYSRSVVLEWLKFILIYQPQSVN